MSVKQYYWDSDAFLGWLQEEPGKVDLCRESLERAQNGELLLVTSALTIAEVLWLRNHPPLPADRAGVVRRFFRRSCIRVCNVTRKISEDAQTLVWDHGIKPKDAIHVATAIHFKLDTLETFDDGLIAKSGTVGSPLLLIRKPLPPTQGGLDFYKPL
jgi:predicted nucleic acid-binding protein